MATGLTALNASKKVAGACIVTVAISAFLPWVSVLGISVSGISRDGSVTFVCALVAAVVFGLGTNLIWPPKLPRLAYLIASGLLAAIVALVGIADMNSFAAIGLYLTMLGGIVWFAAVITDVRQVREVAPQDPAVPDDV